MRKLSKTHYEHKGYYFHKSLVGYVGYETPFSESGSRWSARTLKQCREVIEFLRMHEFYNQLKAKYETITI